MGLPKSSKNTPVLFFFGVDFFWHLNPTYFPNVGQVESTFHLAPSSNVSPPLSGPSQGRALGRHGSLIKNPCEFLDLLSFLILVFLAKKRDLSEA